MSTPDGPRYIDWDGHIQMITFPRAIALHGLAR
jgi:hypothetical protein